MYTVLYKKHLLCAVVRGLCAQVVRGGCAQLCTHGLVVVRCSCLHNRLAQPHLLMRSALHNVRPEVAQRFLCGISSFLVVRFCLWIVFKLRAKTPKPKLLGFLQADLDQNLSGWSSSDSLPFYQVFTGKSEGKNNKKLKNGKIEKSEKLKNPKNSIYIV